MIKKNYSYFIKLAFEQAKINLGSTGTNPSVGCVIEKNGSIISSGFTGINGRPHAEFNALNKKIKFKNANAYTSLEPCSHYGKTPPCTNIISKKKIKKVFFPINDFDKITANKAQKILKKRGIKSYKLSKTKYALDFYKSYYLNKIHKLPIVDAKIAISNDYFTKSKDKKFITNIHSIRRVHLLRSFYDCILSTSKSINEDNSILDCRINGLQQKSPDVVIIDRNLILKKKLNIFNNRKRKIYLFTSTYNKKQEVFLKKKGVKLIRFKSLDKKEDFYKILKIINDLGYSRLFIEAGLKFLYYLFANKLLNNIFVFKSKNSLYTKGTNSININFIKKIKLKMKVKVNLFGDLLYKVKLK
jgi:diaminohydroxyphosphoribosylaminopyrimidine deaminase/5-amino-6-(5-phosphoribosylamino)uracil reductase